jgi:Sigma-70 region 2
MEYAGGRSVVFEQLRRRLFSVAYRMTGTRADAENIIQEAYLRWHQADTGEGAAEKGQVKVKIVFDRRRCICQPTVSSITLRSSIRRN